MSFGFGKNESGRLIRLAALFNMLPATDIKYLFTKPDGSTIEKSMRDGDVKLQLDDIEDDILGPLIGGEYCDLITDETLLDQAGSWSVRLVYENSGNSPIVRWKGSCVNFTVEDCGLC